MYLVTADDMREMDRQSIETFGIPGRVLMENAGRGAAGIMLKHFNELHQKKVGVIAGRGNNGGDGFVIARYLAQKNVDVTVFLLARAQDVKGDAAANFTLLGSLGIPVFELPDRHAFAAHELSLQDQQIWIDAILGTGLRSDVKAYYQFVIEFINRSAKPVFSVDIPSGLNADTGQACGACIRAQTTATFAFAKIGHLIYPGASYTGNLHIVDIGIPPFIAHRVGPRQSLLTSEEIRSYFRIRPPETHKGDTGHVLVVAGSPGKTGAAAMTAMAAMRVGAGLVTLGVPQSLNSVLEPQVLEVMTHPLPETDSGLLGESAYEPIMALLHGKKCLAVGPGIGTHEETQKLVQRLIQNTDVPVVLDADGLNCLAENTHGLAHCHAPAVLTPHPGEMARLTGTKASDVQRDRIACSREFAEKFGVHIVLKGARTLIAHPDGRVAVNPSGNPGMASGGMGDVLTGIICGLIAQGFTLEAATHAGVFLHGAAADSVADACGPQGYLASEVMRIVPAQIKNLMNGRLTAYAVTQTFP